MGYAFLLDCFVPRFLSPINTISSLYGIVFICAVFWEKINMAEKVEIDIPGIGLIEAKNAATEATLLEILKVMQGTQKAIQQQGKDKGKGGSNVGGAGKADAANMAAFNKEQQSAGKSFSILGAAARGVGLAFNTVGKTAGIAVGGFNRMAGGAAMAAGATDRKSVV